VLTQKIVVEYADPDVSHVKPNIRKYTRRILLPCGLTDRTRICSLLAGCEALRDIE